MPIIPMTTLLHEAADSAAYVLVKSADALDAGGVGFGEALAKRSMR